MKLSWLGFIFLIAFVSCSKDETPENFPKQPSINFTPMSVGSYWIYGHYNIDTSGNESVVQKQDCVYVSKTEVINGKTYHVFEGTYYPIKLNQTRLWALRDSSGYIVDSLGNITFSSHDFKDSLETKYELNSNGDTLVSHVWQMRKVLQPITVPAGTYYVLNFHGTTKGHAILPPKGVNNPRSWNTYYGNNVGRILETYFYIKQYGISERRLLRYHIQ